VDAVLFAGWGSLGRTLLIGILAYAALVSFLRISGKRTLSKLNAFDWVVTVALGSTLASVLLTKSVAFADGALAFALLIGLQLIVTWISVRARWFRRAVTGEPEMLLQRGEFVPEAMRRTRITQDEVRAAIRSSGTFALSDVEAVVLETDGSMSVVKRGSAVGPISLEDVKGYTRQK